MKNLIENQAEIEFINNLLFWSVAFLGIFIALALFMVVLGYMKQRKKKNLTKEIYEQTKERPNGRG